MSRLKSTPASAAPAFPLSAADKSFLARVETLIVTITDRIAAFTENYNPALRPPSPRYPLCYNYFSYPREYNACARTLRHLHELWTMLKTLLHQSTLAVAAPAAPGRESSPFAQPVGAHPFAAAPLNPQPA